MRKSIKQLVYEEAKKGKPELMKKGQIHYFRCINPTDTLTKGKNYGAIKHTAKLTKLNCGNGEYVWDWIEYITVYNDRGDEVTTRKSRFERMKLVNSPGKTELVKA